MPTDASPILEQDASLRATPLRQAELEAYAAGHRLWQGVPAIEREAGGRLWAAWYSGGETEGGDNYVLLATSEDDGQQWSDVRLVIDPPGSVRAFDPVLWHDPAGRLWLFWSQSFGLFDGRAGVWAVCCSDSASATPTWSEPQRLCNGIMMNKPTVLSSGEWLLPTAIWNHREPKRPDMAAERYSNAVCSTDNGQSWSLLGRADVPGRTCDEHMFVERRDGRLWMLVRTEYGIGQSFSHDAGRTWSPGERTGISHLNSRFFIRRLASGRLLLIKHHNFDIDKDGKPVRSHLTAFLSEDDGDSWYGELLLDERHGVSYPDAVEAADGRIFIIYDHERFKDKEILLAIVREQDIATGRCASESSRLKQVVDKAGDAEAPNSAPSQG